MKLLNTSEMEIRELDHRTADGIDVRLLWNSRTNQVFVTVEDHRYGEGFEIRVRGSEALAAFHHPFAYRTIESYARGVAA
jgi:hypothetical protein